MDKIYELLKRVRPDGDFENSKNFMSDGYLDSYDIVALIADIEDEFGVLINGMDIIPENFVGIEAIRELIERSPKA